MLFQIKHSGQLCNRLFSLLPAVSYAIHKEQVLYVLFENKEYLDYFQNIKNNHYIRFRFLKTVGTVTTGNWLRIMFMRFRRYMIKWFEKIAPVIIRYDKHLVKLDLADLNNSKALCCVDGWEHRGDLSFIKEERKTLLELFMPESAYVMNVEKEFVGYDGITVGVHVRRGDYKEYCNGKWYFDDETYMDAMRQINSELIKGGERKIRFLICSNEPFSAIDEGLELFKIRPLFPADCMTDLYALSKCDFIIGPPSTFSQWASYYGNVPLRFLKKRGEKVSMSDFLPVVLLDRNEKGWLC